VISALQKPLTDPKIGKVAHNAKYDYIVLAKHGLKVSPITFDSMIAEFVIDPSSHNLGLKNLAFVRLGEEMIHIEELIGKGRKQITMAEVAIESVAPYAAADAETTLRLMPILRAELERVNSMKLLDEIEMPLISVLADMEMIGVLLDLPFFKTMSGELASAWPGSKNRFLNQLASHSTSTPLNNFQIFYSHACGLNHPIKGKRLPADITPHRLMCSKTYEVNIRL
jgi:DNA polymerase-1